MRFRIVLTAAALAVAGGLARAEGPAVRETAGVSLIEVPVTVHDAHGKAVRGLVAGDFDVRDDGKPVAIQAVDVEEIAAPRAPGAPPEPPRPPVSPAARRRFLLLFDVSFSTPSRLTRVREAARKFVTEQLGPDDLAAVATYSVEHGLNLVVSFTADRAQLASAVTTLGLVNPGASTAVADPLNLARSFGIEEGGTGGPPAAAINPALREQLLEMNRQIKVADVSQRQARVASLIQSFGLIARALNSVQGRKQILYFSQGFDMRLVEGNSQDADEVRRQNMSSTEGRSWEVDNQQRFGSSALQSALNDMLDLFKRSDCVVDSIDLTGISAGGNVTSPVSSERDELDPSGGSGQRALFAIANGTGGELFENANDFSLQLNRLLEEQRVVYVLTFSPKSTGRPDRFHSLKVRVRKPGMTVAARAGYYEPRPFLSSSSAERSLAAADAISAEIPVRDLPVIVTAQAFAGSDSPEATVQVFVPPSELEPPKGERLPVEIYVYVYDDAGKIADFSAENAVLDLSQTRARLDEGGLRFFTQFRLRPGNYRLHTLVRNGATGAMGFESHDLVVPDFQRGPVLVAPLAVGNARGLVLRGKAARSNGEPAFPYLIGAEAFLPDPNPAVVRSQTLKFCLYT
ncbi:MAG: VWA domain-containing protein, partial [Thermoanaerobaculia bacterium]